MTPPELPLPAFAPVWDDATHASAVALFDRAMRVARAIGADPMLDGGTLLGHQRHDGRVIPWDDDLDVVIDATDFHRYMEALADEPGIAVAIVEQMPFGKFGKAWWRADTPSPGNGTRRAWGWPFLDVFRYADRGETLVLCPEGRERRHWPRDLALPAVPAVFEGVPALIPRYADRILDLQFPNWRIAFDSGEWDHRREHPRHGRASYMWNPAGIAPEPAATVVYADACADLFHAGHANFFRQARSLGDRLVVGIHDDATIASYKRAPVQTLAERVAAVAACRYVDQVVPGAPLCVTPRYLDNLGAHVVCHGDEITPAALERMYGPVASTHRIVLVPYTPGISTRALRERILARGPTPAQSGDERPMPGTSRQ